jgi:hypothetical protein
MAHGSNQMGFGASTSSAASGEPRLYRIVQERTATCDTMQVEARELIIDLSDDVETSYYGFEAALGQVIEDVRTNGPPNDYIMLSINNTVGDTTPVVTDRVPRHQLDSGPAMAEVMKLMQSAKSFVCEGRLVVTITTISMPTGSGRKTKRELVEELHFIDTVWMRYPRSLLRAKNLINDGHQKSVFADLPAASRPDTSKLCFLYAAVAAKWHLDARLNSDLTKIEIRLIQEKTVKQTSKDFCMAVRKLYDSLQMDFTNGSEPKVLQALEDLWHVRLVCYENLCSESTFYIGPATDRPILCMLLYDNHWGALLRPHKVFGYNYFCEKCLKPHDNKGHKCIKKACYVCQSDCSSVGQRVVCTDCNIVFRSPDCYDNHRLKRLCRVRFNCRTCGEFFTERFKGHTHTHNTRYCTYCKEDVEPTHACYILQAPLSEFTEKKEKNTILFFADFETSQNTVSGENKFLHKAVLACVESVCIQCRETEFAEGEECDNCGPREATFHCFEDPQINVVAALINHVVSKCKAKTKQGRNKDAVLIFHNASGFDGILIMNYITSSLDFQEISHIADGQKIMKTEFKHKESRVQICIKDFFLFVPKPLASLPAAFKLKDELESPLAKGHAPFLLIGEQNFGYRLFGKLPELKYYAPDNMSVKKRAELIAWHEAESQRLRSNDLWYDLKQELIAYCRLDVRILRKAAVSWEKCQMRQNVSPFIESFTLAGMCNIIFRRNFLQPKTIGLIPRGGYRGIQSKKALTWLYSVEEELGHHIEHAGRCKERNLFGYPCDGYESREEEQDGVIVQKHIVYDFLGCVFHGHR